MVKYTGAEVKKAINPISLKFSHWSGFVYVTYWPITVKRCFIVTQNSTGNAMGYFGRCCWEPTLCMTTTSWSLTRCVAIYRSGSKDLIPIRLPIEEQMHYLRRRSSLGQIVSYWFYCLFCLFFGVYRPTQEFFTHMETSYLFLSFIYLCREVTSVKTPQCFRYVSGSRLGGLLVVDIFVVLYTC